ncbi:MULTISPECIES: RNA polymerase sigma factor [Caulobacter]|uniref:RNA polymerase sigma factor n=2 Tax=Caulobacter vibrioides TaxID=155892 RepID=Q9A7S1_CAUVC|nr:MULTISPECIES: RNA polymerase sigma factor [Caulobacter]YP_002517094.1 RNA polymerase ECF sigma factor [Caulobacter vibrioides NA1000]AAK23627.1 RNA polymerase sigma-70 factor, ECF subfamily [Caulobacter vibrioides CB15]ACL95186.1 RNA polymerase ECF sigma factor [Caulobacter vibrioides NA1000]ATC28532.1 RNA polymerase sigma factor [Caulobacter vibrioides]MCY1647657.1 RNA polymerase sigma factor [Caulobacter sp. SL161]QXZ53714.1 RNA polymerase sigma factor [Caulobacter vibrioides]
MISMGMERPPTGHDVELAAQAAAGDRLAYGELVRRHGSTVRGLLRRLGADAATADDLAQDAFMTGFEQVAEFRGEGTFGAWIKKIAARLYLKRVKREARLIFSDNVEPLEEISVRDASGDAASRIDLDEALKSLSRGERLCVSLCYGADWSHGEAAEALNIPIGTVKSHVKRGLDKLRAKLARPDEGARREAHG